ncbi:ABC transporter ATP-binding protein [Solwaraspora sp. WMMB335]|uniref:ABC transporter ATP-binding protein n=1 Tax=Solwaraspora sp. WMMB335 TaxID=3404118 RepID=UPI003B92FDDC
MNRPAPGGPAAPGPVRLELRGFGWRHAGRRSWAVRDVDLRVEEGERVLLLGASGAGKSTLLAALAGLLPTDSGERAGTVAVDGLDPHQARERVGIVFQDPQTQLVMARSGDDVAFGLENRGVPADRIWPRVDAALARVGFRYARDRPTAALSGGEQQRLALAGVLALRPALLLLDEPTANLDPAGAALVREALTGALAGDRRTTMVLVEHRVAEALPLVDRVVVLEPGGGVRADGPPAEVFRRHGAELAAAGVWVPGRPLPVRRAGAPAGEILLHVDRVGQPPRLATLAGQLPVRAGETLAVLGPNGVGKTTLALLLGGLAAPGTGTVRATIALTGGRVGAAPHRWRAPELVRRIGTVFQNPEHQFVTASVADELAVGPRRCGMPAPAVGRVVDELLGRLRLDRLARANPYTLSGGEARRLSVATALATAPGLLVLDEPTFGQDRRTWIELVGLLAEVRDAGHAIVAVTHDAAFVDALADRRLTL